MNEKKQLSINISAQLISFSLNLMINFLLTQFLVNNIGTETFGFIGLANNFIQYIEVVTVAFNTMASRFITIKILQNDINGANEYFSTVLIGNILISIVLIPITFVFLLNIDKFINISIELVKEVKILWGVIFVNFIFSLISSVYAISTFVKNRLEIVSINNAIGYIVKAVILIIMFNIMIPSVTYVGIATVIATIVSLIINIKVAKKLLPEIQFKIIDIRFKLARKLLVSGMWSSLSKLSAILSSGIDLLISNIMIDSIAMGKISIARTIPLMIISCFTVITNVFAPQLTIYYAKKEIENIKKSLEYSIKGISVFSNVIISIFIILANDFYRLWVPKESSQFLTILSVIVCIQMIIYLPLQPLNNIFPMVNKLKLPALSVFISGLLTVIFEIVMIKTCDNYFIKVVMIVLSSAIFEIFRSVLFIPIYSSKCIGIESGYIYKIIFKNSVIFCILVIIYRCFSRFIVINTWLRIIIVGIIMAVIGLIVNWLLLLTKSERELFTKNIKSRVRN